MSLTIVGISGGPEAGTGAARTELLELSQVTTEEAVAALTEADGVVFGSPVFRASYSAALKDLLERTERGKWGEKSDPLRGTVAATVLTGASGHHFLAANDHRNVLASFFAVQVLSPGLYFDHSAYESRTELTEASATLAAAHGTALADLAAAVRDSKALSAITPQI